MCSCCRQETASAWTRESEWSCITAQHTRQDNLAVAMEPELPRKYKHSLDQDIKVDQMLLFIHFQLDHNLYFACLLCKFTQMVLQTELFPLRTYVIA